MTQQAYLNPAVRAECCETLVRELVLRTFGHDVRGAVMGVTGWVELGAMDGNEPPQGLTRSLERLSDIVSRYDMVTVLPADERVNPMPLVAKLLSCPVEGFGEAARVSPVRLLSALELAEPSAVTFAVEHRGGIGRLQIQVHGLPPEGVQLAMAPHYNAIVERVRRRDRVLGACLLRVVARGAGGEVRGAPPDRLDLTLPLS